MGSMHWRCLPQTLSTPPGPTQQIDAMAKKHGVTIVSSGMVDCYGVHVTNAIAGACNQVDSITVDSEYEEEI